MSILAQIIEDTRQLVAERKREIAVSTLQKSAHFKAPTLPLHKALRKDDLTVIAELKKASPSKGIIRNEFKIKELAREYKEGGAAAISVLTEPFHFKGAPEFLMQARSVVDLPILRKDFVIDEYQLLEARSWGADAVLLIAECLEAQRLYDLHQTATELGLSCLVEVHHLDELDKLDFDQVKVLGVNNRDLKTFKVDLNQSLRVFAHVPENIVRVAESGLRTAEDLAYLRTNGVDAVLIGETFMRAPHPGHKLAELIRETNLMLEQAERLVMNTI